MSVFEKALVSEIIEDLGGALMTATNCSEAVFTILATEDADLRHKYQKIVNGCSTGKMVHDFSTGKSIVRV